MNKLKLLTSSQGVDTVEKREVEDDYTNPNIQHSAESFQMVISSSIIYKFYFLSKNAPNLTFFKCIVQKQPNKIMFGHTRMLGLI